MEPEDTIQIQNQSQENQARESGPQQGTVQEGAAVRYSLVDTQPEGPRPAATPPAVEIFEPHSSEASVPESRLSEAQPPEARLEDHFDSNYRYVLVAARRARQLQNGAPPLVATQSSKASRVAQDEIAAGMVKYIRTPRAESAVSRAAGSLSNTYSSYR